MIQSSTTVMMLKAMLARTENCLFESNLVPVLWVFQDYDGQWRLRKEGDAADVAFPCRKDAVEAARSYGQMRGAYRLYLQLTHGRFTLELLNTGAAKPRSSRTNVEVERSNVFSPMRQDRGGQANLLPRRRERTDKG